MSDTPETDNFIASAGYVRTDHQWRTFARMLERERDAARQQEQIHHDNCLAMQNERDEWRDCGKRLLSVMRWSPDGRFTAFRAELERLLKEDSK